MAIDRAATAPRQARPDDGAMNHARGQVASAEGRDLDPDVRRFIRGVADSVARFPPFEGAPYPQVRKWVEEVRKPWRQGGPAMHATRELQAPTRHGSVRLRLHLPAPGVLPVLVYLHGGGWTVFSVDTHDRVMREYAARAGCCVIGVDYALAPEHKYPIALEQVADVVEWLRGEAGALGIDADRLALGGDSAGANLSVAACLLRRERKSTPPVRAMVLNYGAFVTQCSADACRRYGGPDYMLGCEEMAVYWRNYLRSSADADDPLACPLLADLAGLPPAFLAVAECDILAEQSIEMSRRLQVAGVPSECVVYRGASHSFLEAMSLAEVSNRALADGAAWLENALRAGDPVPAGGTMA